MFKFSIALNENNGETYGIKNLEIKDGFYGESLSKLSPEKLENIRCHLIKTLSKIVLYTATESIKNYDSYVLFFRHAHIIGVENVLLSGAAIKGAAKEEILKIVAIGEAFAIKVLFEVEAEGFDEFNFDTYKEIKSEATGLVFDPLELLKRNGQSPFFGPGGLYKSKFKDDVVFLKIKDADKTDMTPLLPEKGHSEIKECMSTLISRSYAGYFSFEKYGEDIEIADVITAATNALCNM